MAVDDKFNDSAEATFHGGSGVGTLDPLVLVPAMASVTKNVSFGVTGSTSYINPYILARTISTLDHVSNGRFAWNVVTSYSDTAAKAMGKLQVTGHDRRYEEAHEFMDLVYTLLEGSWEDGASIWSAEKGAYDFSKVHKVNFDGLYHRTVSYGPMHPSPQRTPVLFQAGTSSAGSAFAAKHAEAIFCGGHKPSETKRIVDSIRAAAAANGRDPNHVKFFPQITPILGRTVEEAQAKYEKALANVDYAGGLAKMSGYLGVDFGQYPLDEPFVLDDSKPDSGIHAMITALQRYSDLPMTPRRIGQQMAFCGFAAMPVGTPEMVADVFEEWANEGDIDGFNIAYVSNPMSYEDIVELLVPVLQERGIMWKDYTVPGGTFRENLLREPGTSKMPDCHVAAQFRYENLKKQDGVIDGKGDIWIKRKEPPQAESTLPSAPVAATEDAVEKVSKLKVNGTSPTVNAEA
ncbi:dimethyl-sulfide monooxygenase-3 [Coleophoma crateriformis]|uniref:Dimethyl-sulfide monooxygenase-3 n=1 Tax=Coleophoma crateriformis TaxID=565419 RepID=A0A3D8QQY8_9HELO|nr:dimethyl-sulfide monooxygenase-3 [Coleophoma crateriformis]